MSDRTGTAEQPQISLPQGGGAIRGIGETFSVNTFNGAAQFGIPIALTPTRSNMQPQLQLDYSPAAGNGVFGEGFRLSLASVERRTEKGLPRYRDDGEHPDQYVLSGSEELVPVLVPAAGGGDWLPEAVPDATERVGGVDRTYRIQRFRPRTESQYLRIERREDAADSSIHWRVTTRDNLTRIFGRSPEARISDPDNDRRVFRWLLESAEDALGNRVEYAYKPDDATEVPVRGSEVGRRYAQRYPKHIRYGNWRDAAGAVLWAFHVVFDYGEHNLDDPWPESHPWPARPDRYSEYRAGFELRTTRRCARVLLFHHFPGELGPDPVLARSTDFAYREDPATGLSLLKRVSQRSYEREDAPAGASWRSEDGTEASTRYRIASLPPLTLTHREFDLEARNLRLVETRSAAEAPPRSLAREGVTFVDLRGDGLPDVLDASTGQTLLWSNRGRSRLDAPRVVDTVPAEYALGSDGVRLADITGDGRPDLVVQRDDVAGFFPADPERGFAPFRSFARIPTLDLADPAARMIDLTGDGRADVLASSPHHFLWFPSQGEKGFGDPVAIERRSDLARFPDVDLADPRVRFADMSGDGLVDIVWIHEGRVDYWPNLGYGRFGDRITMDGAPRWPANFDENRLHLADLDGTGCADLIYVGDGSLRIWRNRLGDGWSDAMEVAGTPCPSDAGAVRFVDFLGSGTATLLFTEDAGHGSGRWWCLDLLDGHKPWTLASVDNHMGAVQRLEYVSSTELMVEDRDRGLPWVSETPFPVQVVRSVEQIDAISGSRLRTGYRYAHPYYDGREREFRGFGRVDQRDTELFDADLGVDSPPRLERTWYHTGAYLEEEDFLERYALEQWSGDAAAIGLEGNDLRGTPEATRALRGAVLRREVYGLDGTPEARTPYSVEEHRYSVATLQPGHGGRPAAHELRTRHVLTFDYERNAADPHVEHEIALDYDPLGHPLTTVNVRYPRRGPVEPEQAVGRIAVNESSFARTPPGSAAFRHGSEYEARTWVVGNAGLASTPPLAAADVRALLAAAPAIRYHEPAPAGPYRRLVEHRQSYALRDDGAGPLPLGEVGALGLPHHSRQLVFERPQLDALFDGRAPDALVEQLGYVRQGAEFWARSEERRYDPTRFYLPDQVKDPLGRVVTTLEYDAFSLLKTRVADAAGNESVATNDYRTLQPVVLRDTNGNREAVALDVRGVVVARAARGKAGSNTGESVGAHDRFVAVDPLVDPHAHLQGATVAFAYDPFAWEDNRLPVWIQQIARVQHESELGPGERSALRVQRMHSDGFGREIQRKVRVRPGDAPIREPDGSLRRNPDGSLVHAFAPVRWVGSGRIVHNNKGEPVVSYDPFFSADAAFEPEAELRETAPGLRTHRDALGRVVRTVSPDGRVTRIVSTGWRLETHDENDAVLGSEWYLARVGFPAGHPDRRAADASAAHAGTPDVEHLDPAGETFLTERQEAASGAVLQSRAVFDDMGNRIELRDPRGVVLERTDFDLLGNELRRVRDGEGMRRVLRDVLGVPVLTWDADDRLLRHRTDALKRPVALELTEDGATRVLRTWEYGESVAGSVAQNLRGEVLRIRDESGIREWLAYDHAGHALGMRRQLLADPATVVDWAAPPALTGEWLTTAATYDATGAVRSRTTPDAGVVSHEYDEAGRVREVRVAEAGQAPFSAVVDTEYDARGRRTHVVYGNGVERTYCYHPVSGRTLQVRTERGDGSLVEHLELTQDAAGNLVRAHDHAVPTVFANNVGIDGTRSYVYDSLYRLVEARGREHRGVGPTHYKRADAKATAFFSPDSVNPADAQALRVFTRRYTYDASGNLTRIRHAPSVGDGWTRTLRYGAASNRLVDTDAGGSDPLFAPVHDASGNVVSLPHVAGLEYDVHGRLVRAQPAGADVRYGFDSEGTRVRKSSASGDRVEERIVIGDYERFRRIEAGVVVFERETLSVSDDMARVALIELRTLDTASSEAGEPARRVRYQHGDHLGSSTQETDEAGALVASEEYFPFGGTAYIAAGAAWVRRRRRYRYNGKERDDETGLYHYGARSYAPWLGRWTGPDPAGLAGGPNPYAYVSNNPIRFWDPQGMQGADTNQPEDGTAVAPVFQLRFGMGEKPEVKLFNSFQLTLGSEFDVRTYVTIGGEAPSPAGASGGGAGAGAAPPPEEERTFWSRGGGTLVSGLAMVGFGALILMGPIGIVAGLTAGMLLAGGIAFSSIGTAQLAMSPWTTAKQDRDMNNSVRRVSPMLSPGGLVGSAVGAAVTGDEEGLEKGAMIGGLTEAGTGLARGLYRLFSRELKFYARYRTGSYNWRRSKRLKPALRHSFGLGPSAERRTNPLMNWRGTPTEFMELSHSTFFPQHATRGREWLFNRPWNLKPMWTTDHALIDPDRWNFMSRAFKSAHEGQQLRGIPQLRLNTPDWMLDTGFGLSHGGGLLLRDEILSPPD